MKPRCGRVEHISAFVSGDGQQLITIDGQRYAAVIDYQRFPLTVGSIVEFVPAGNRVTITAVQADLISLPLAAGPFTLVNSAAITPYRAPNSALNIRKMLGVANEGIHGHF